MRPDGPALLASLCCTDTSLITSVTSAIAAFIADAGATLDQLLLPPSTKLARAAQHTLIRSHLPRLRSDVAYPDGAACVRLRWHPPLKAVALDLDGTLWPGVLLEEGSADPAAWPAYTALGSTLLRLQASGVLLFTCSRNDEVPVLAAWPPAHLCPVQPCHAVAHAFGWTAKSDRLSRLAHAIGLAHDAILFLDDTAAERAEVRQALPCVRVLGEDMATAADVLAWEADRCASAGVSADAASRTEKTRALLARAAAAEAFTDNDPPDDITHGLGPRIGGDKTRRRAARTMGARLRVSGTGGGYATVGGFPLTFLRTLSLSLTLRRHCAAEAGAPPPALQTPSMPSSGLARAAELASRTTQFSTAVALPFRAWGAPQAARLAQLEDLVQSGCGEVWTMSCRDRFGEHGMVGVAALEGGTTRRIHLIAVSCRVLALEVAPVFAAEVLRRSACLAGDSDIAASLALTDRNAPCRTLFARLGFERVADASDKQQEWVLRGGTAGVPQTDAAIYAVTEDHTAEDTDGG